MNVNEESVVNPGSAMPLPASVEPLHATAANEPLAGDSIETASTLGQLLRAAREKAGLSAGDIASRLRMGVKQVRALEQDEFAALPTGTFLRGFVRNFAKEVGVKPERALGLLEETHRAAMVISASAVIIPSRQNIRVPAPGGALATPRGRVLFAVGIVGVLLAAFWYWWEYVLPHRAQGGRPNTIDEANAVSVPIALPAPPAITASTEAGGAQQNGLAAPAAAQAQLSSSATTLPAAAIGEPSTPPTVEIAPAAPRPALPAGSGSLGFTFSGESWVEVIDGNGKSLLARKFRSGEAEELRGRAPFSVVIGNAQATRMAYQGKEIDLVPHTRVSVARLTIK